MLFGYETHIGQLQLGGLLVNLLVLDVVLDGTASNFNVFDVVETQNAASLDACAGTIANYVADMDVLEIGSHLLLFFSEGWLGIGITACRTVYVVALEDDSFVLDVVHHNMLDKHLLGFAATTHATFEAQTCIGAADEDILTAVSRNLWLVVATLHAESVVASINDAVNDKSDIYVREVYSITILGVPWTAYSNTVDNNILGVTGVQVKLRRILDGNALDKHILATLKTYQVVAQLLLFLWGLGNIGITAFGIEGVPEFATILLNTANHLFIFIPLHIAHLLALDGAPVVAVAVDDALARNSDSSTATDNKCPGTDERLLQVLRESTH